MIQVLPSHRVLQKATCLIFSTAPISLLPRVVHVRSIILHGLSSLCSAVAAAFFWQFVDKHCPFTLEASRCRRCYFYSASICAADSATCFTGTETGYACPYTICRQGILLWMHSTTLTAYQVGVALAVFETLVLVFVVSYLAVHVIERIDWYPFKIYYRLEKPNRPKEYAVVTLIMKSFKDEDEENPLDAPAFDV